MKKRRFLLMAVAVVCVSSVHAQSGRLSFTAVAKTSSFGPDGVVRQIELTTYGYRSNGARAEYVRRYAPSNTTAPIAESRRVLDIPGKREVGIDPFTESLATFPIPPVEISKYELTPDPSCKGETENNVGATIHVQPEPASIAGYRAIQIEYAPMTVQGKRISRQRWLAPDLDCFPMKEVSSLRFSLDGRLQTAVVQKEVVQVLPGEPDPALFEVPAGFTERAPSQMFAEAARRRGESECRACEQAAVSKMDEAYHKRRGE